MLDHYATLQVDRGASADEIKRAYRKLAKELHPDLRPNDPLSARRFKDITAAYDVLSDQAKRRQYDGQVAAAAAARRAQPRPDDDGLDAFFGRSWGFRRDQTQSGPKLRGADIYQSIGISFIDAALGARKRLVVKDERVLDIVIPPLTQDGQTLRLKGQGGHGTGGGPQGDIFVEVTVEPHPLFTRKELDIHMVLPVSLPEAILGTTANVPTVHGLVSLKIPKGSNTDTVLRLRGKGLRGATGNHGDQLVTLKVILPDAKDAELVKFIEQWAAKHPYQVRPRYS